MKSNFDPKEKNEYNYLKKRTNLQLKLINLKDASAFLNTQEDVQMNLVKVFDKPNIIASDSAIFIPSDLALYEYDRSTQIHWLNMMYLYYSEHDSINEIDFSIIANLKEKSQLPFQKKKCWDPKFNLFETYGCSITLPYCKSSIMNISLMNYKCNIFKQNFCDCNRRLNDLIRVYSYNLPLFICKKSKIKSSALIDILHKKKIIYNNDNFGVDANSSQYLVDRNFFKSIGYTDKELDNLSLVNVRYIYASATASQISIEDLLLGTMNKHQSLIDVDLYYGKCVFNYDILIYFILIIILISTSIFLFSKNFIKRTRKKTENKKNV